MSNPMALEHQRKLRNKILHGKRGLKALPLSAEMLLQLFKTMDGSKAYRCEGLPPDAQIVNIEVDRKSGQVILILSSHQFEASVLETRLRWLDMRFLC